MTWQPRCSRCFAVMFVLCLTSTAHAYISNEERRRKHPEVFDFPFTGRGDPDHSFLHPYIPSPGGDPIDGWFQLGTTSISRSRSGRDIVRLTGAGQANQGVLYNAVRTETNNFNGYVDIQMDAVRESHEAADGMGIFFVRDRPELGSAMGITHRFQGLGIIVDTFSNSRTRHVPYLYAYISDGKKEWNPDTDGSDTELTRGCQLEMNTQIRIYIQYVDEVLQVGVAMNPRQPHRWHFCFKVSNVRLPFNDGGYLAFAGETGHFFALHEVHDAAFVDESPYSGESFRSDYHEQVYDDHRYANERYHDSHYDEHHVDHDSVHHDGDHYSDHGHGRDSHADEYHHQSDKAGERSEAKGASSSQSDVSSRVHRGTTAEESLSGSLDLQVYDVFSTMSSALRGLHDKESEDAKLRLDGVRDVTGHLIKEMQKQRAELTDVIKTMRHLKESSGELSYESDRFTRQLRGMHSSLATLKHRIEDVIVAHDDVHSDLIDHHMTMENKKGGSGVLVLFFVVQLLLVAGVFAVQKMNMSSRKLGRMV